MRTAFLFVLLVTVGAGVAAAQPVPDPAKAAVQDKTRFDELETVRRTLVQRDFWTVGKYKDATFDAAVVGTVGAPDGDRVRGMRLDIAYNSFLRMDFTIWAHDVSFVEQSELDGFSTALRFIGDTADAWSKAPTRDYYSEITYRTFGGVGVVLIYQIKNRKPEVSVELLGGVESQSIELADIPKVKALVDATIELLKTK